MQMNPRLSGRVDYAQWASECFTARGLSVSSDQGGELLAWLGEANCLMCSLRPDKVATLRFPAPFDVAKEQYLAHSQEASNEVQGVLQAIAPTQFDAGVPELEDLLTLFAGLLTTWPTARDCIMFGGVSTLTDLIQPQYKEIPCVALGVIAQLCRLAPLWPLWLALTKADTLTSIQTSLESPGSLPLRAVAARAVTSLVTSLEQVVSKDFDRVLRISKLLVDNIKRDSWENEGASATALWAIADVEFNEEEVSSSLDRRCAQYENDGEGNDDPALLAQDDFGDE